MSRAPLPRDRDPFGDEVVWAWSQTTTQQREMAFDDWLSGRKLYHVQVSQLLHLVPDALLLACLLEFGHELVCHPNGRPKVNHYGKLRDLMNGRPVDNSAKTVDKSVDKSVDNPVDNLSFYPQISLEPMF